MTSSLANSSSDSSASSRLSSSPTVKSVAPSSSLSPSASTSSKLLVTSSLSSEGSKSNTQLTSTARQWEGVASDVSGSKETSQSTLTAPVTTSIQTTILSTSSGHIVTTVVEVETVLSAGSTITSLSSSSASSHSHTGAIIAGVLGGLSGLLVILACGLFFFLRLRRQKGKQDYRNPDTGETATFDGNFDPDRIAEVTGVEGARNRGRSGARPSISPRAKRARSRSFGFDKKSLFGDEKLDEDKFDEFEEEGGTLPHVSIDLTMDMETDTETLALGHDAPPRLDVVEGDQDWFRSEMKHLMADDQETQGRGFNNEDGLDVFNNAGDVDDSLGGHITATSTILFPHSHYRSSPDYTSLLTKDQEYIANGSYPPRSPFLSTSTSFSSTTHPMSLPPSPTHPRGLTRPLSSYGCESSSSHAYPPYPMMNAGYTGVRRTPSPGASSVFNAHWPVFSPIPVPVAGPMHIAHIASLAATDGPNGPYIPTHQRTNGRPIRQTPSPGAINAYYSSAHDDSHDNGGGRQQSTERSLSPNAFSTYDGYEDWGNSSFPALHPSLSFAQRTRRASSPGAYSAFAATARVERTRSGYASLSPRSPSPDALSVYEVHTAYRVHNAYDLPPPQDSRNSRAWSCSALGPMTGRRNSMSLGTDGDENGRTTGSVESDSGGRPLVVTNPDPSLEDL